MDMLPYLKTLGERLEYVREEVLRDGSPYQLANRLEGRQIEGSTHASIRRYEKDERVPRADFVNALADESGVPVEWIMTGRVRQGGGEALRLRVIGQIADGEIGQETLEAMADEKVKRPQEPPEDDVDALEQTVVEVDEARQGTTGSQADAKSANGI